MDSVMEMEKGLIGIRSFILRDRKVVLSTDLAGHYKVQPRDLLQVVQCNQERFPQEVMFELTDQEYVALKSQVVISNWGGLRRVNPYAFTEEGAAQLARLLLH